MIQAERIGGGRRPGVARCWTWWRALGSVFALFGPGLLTMAADNDAGGLLSYAATGARFGAAWFTVLLLPLGACAVVVQDMAMRVGAVTGCGLAALIRARFSRGWAWLAGIDLAVQNALTLVTEFVGMGIGLAHFGVPVDVGVPLSCALVLALVLGPRYRAAERAAVGLAVASLLFLPLAAGVLGRQGAAVWVSRPAPQLGLFLAAAVGNALAPWMLFFQTQSSAGRGTSIADGRVDLAAGAFVQVLVAAAVVVLGAAGAVGGGVGGLGSVGGDLFAIGLFDAGLVAALTVSLSTAWAVAETLGGRARPEARLSEAPGFYAAYTVGVMAAAAAVLWPGLAPLRTAVLVQAASAILLPPLVAMLIALANDPMLMPEGRNGRWHNLAAGLVLALFVAACLWLLVGPRF